MKKTFFKTKVAFVCIAILVVVTGSCCTKKYCIGADDMNYIQFSNFSNSDLDTITVQRFSKNSNFATAIEDIMVVTNNLSVGSNSQQIQLPVRLTIDYDYKVHIKSTGETFTITGFVSKKETCNTGFMCNDSYNSLESYLVNGNLKRTYQLEISK